MSEYSKTYEIRWSDLDGTNYARVQHHHAAWHLLNRDSEEDNLLQEIQGIQAKRSSSNGLVMGGDVPACLQRWMSQGLWPGCRWGCMRKLHPGSRMAVKSHGLYRVYGFLEKHFNVILKDLVRQDRDASGQKAPLSMT